MKLTFYYGIVLVTLLLPVVTVYLGIHLASWISLYALVAGSFCLIVYGLLLWFMKVSFPGKHWMAILSLLAGLGWLMTELYMLSGWRDS
ncbi:hypothetical protein [Siphonobacter sp. SORGH_AS_1065]|uniref:hypothetical protein n=1 Tax=Siphonobacter sp. SORGH_AS_1065 TaxID=3041795 RepID=UPI00278B24AA|nr:hypothetical protein [Siphonobacter sp. SORGH_AS_1065]MDQ1089135.1 membrane-bound ClpP family serine protease [Siphonobacter sp. SORGH_AS_1065]